MENKIFPSLNQIPNSRPPTTTPPNPPDDRAKRALQAQAEFFSSKSITKAVKSIISKSEHSVTAEQMDPQIKNILSKS